MSNFLEILCSNFACRLFTFSILRLMADSMVNTGFSVCSAGAGDRIMENDGVLGLSKAANQFYTADLNSHRKVLANSPSDLLGSGVFF